MKKINFLLAGLMLLGLCSCGKGDSTDPTNGNGGTVENQTTILKDGRVGYQIFTNAFADSDKTNNNDMVSGDIMGIVENLDYLKEYLNVDVLWLTPIHRSPSYSGYDPTDYRSVKSNLGGMEAYEKLLAEAHKRDISVMLDLVVNHTSTQHKWFMKSKKGDPKYRDYYRWTDKRVTESRYLAGDSYYYAVFWDQMPDLNYDNPEVYKEMVDACKFWIDKGVDGFRVDGCKHVYNYGDWGGKELYEGADDLGKLNYDKNLEFFNKLSTDLKAYDKDCFMTLEVLDYSADVIADYLKQGVDSCFDFNTRGGLIANVNQGNGQLIANNYQTNLDKFFVKNPAFLNSTMISNHDLKRAMSEFGGNEAKARACAAIQMFLPGLSWIYNGDELGMTGELNNEQHGDLGYRQPYKWGNKYDTDLIKSGLNTNKYDEHNKKLDDAQKQMKDPNSMLNFYKAITKLKSDDEVFKNGDYRVCNLNQGVTSFTRSINGTTYLINVNTRGNAETVQYTLNSPKEVFAYKSKVEGNSIKLEPYGISVLKISEGKASDVETVKVYYKGSATGDLLNCSSSPFTWEKFDGEENGYKVCTIDIKGRSLSSFSFLIGTNTKDGLKVSFPRATYELKSEGKSKVCKIMIDDTKTEYEYSIDIDSSWPYTKGQQIGVWAWTNGASNSKWYEAKIEGNKLIFTLPKEIDSAVFATFASGKKLDWANKIKQTNDLAISRGTLSSSITWK